MSTLQSFIKRHTLIAFFLLAYALTWLGAIPYWLGIFEAPMLTLLANATPGALCARGRPYKGQSASQGHPFDDQNLISPTVSMFPVGPFLAAVIVTSFSGGWPATRALLLRMVQWRVGPRWYALALLVPIAILLCAVYANVLYGAPAPSANFILGALPSVIPIFAFTLLFPLSGAFGEELGWRGFALPRLLARRSALTASLILSVFVVLWHAPLFVTGIYGDIPLRVLSITALTMLFTLIANGSGGSVLLAMLLHAGLNAWPEMLIPAFSGPDLECLMRLFAIASIGAGVIAALVIGSRFAPRLSPQGPLAPAPATA